MVVRSAVLSVTKDRASCDKRYFMKKQSKLFLEKSLDSLLLSIHHFNGAWDRGRSEAVLILLDRAFELLMKAAILHLGGRIRESYETETIGHEKCVRKCHSDNQVKCISDDQALTIQVINSVRDAAQHDIVELSEQELYLYCQSGVTVYRDLLRSVFGEELSNHLPGRVLPVSVSPPQDLHSMVEADFEDIKKLLVPGSRRQIEAKSRLRTTAIVEEALNGVRSQPSEAELNRLVREVKAGKSWQELFPGVASLEIETSGNGINVEIRITKREGSAVHLVSEGSSGASTLAVKRVNELDYYSLGAADLSMKLNVTQPKLVALIWKYEIQNSPDYFKEVRVGRMTHKRYSKQAYEYLKSLLEKTDLAEVWGEYKNR